MGWQDSRARRHDRTINPSTVYRTLTLLKERGLIKTQYYDEDSHREVFEPTPQTVDYGQTTSFTIQPGTGYRLGSISGCGGTLSGNTYTTWPVTWDCTVTALFEPDVYTVTPSAGTHGSLSPSTSKSSGAGRMSSCVGGVTDGSPSHTPRMS